MEAAPFLAHGPVVIRSSSEVSDVFREREWVRRRQGRR